MSQRVLECDRSTWLLVSGTEANPSRSLVKSYINFYRYRVSGCQLGTTADGPNSRNRAGQAGGAVEIELSVVGLQNQPKPAFLLWQGQSQVGSPSRHFVTPRQSHSNVYAIDFERIARSQSARFVVDQNVPKHSSKGRVRPDTQKPTQILRASWVSRHAYLPFGRNAFAVSEDCVLVGVGVGAD